jgi:hypothetical protein
MPLSRFYNNIFEKENFTYTYAYSEIGFLLDCETGHPASVIRRRRQSPLLSRSSQHPTSQSQVSSIMFRFFNFYNIFLLF